VLDGRIFKARVANGDAVAKTMRITHKITTFFHYDKLDNLIEYETSLPRGPDMKAKGFCLYNEDDFNWRLSRIQKKKLLKHHSTELMITTTPNVK
jgi:hypothetical protein